MHLCYLYVANCFINHIFGSVMLLFKDKFITWGRVVYLMTILSMLASAFGVIMGLANAPQAYKIFKYKSARDISVLTYSILLAGGIVFLLYGIETKTWPVVCLNALSTINFVVVLVGYYLYGRKK